MTSPRTTRASVVLLAALLLAVVAACRSSITTTAMSRRSRLPSTAEAGRLVRSNVEARDYAGSAACAACHAEVAEGFLASPMHRMTRMIGDAAVQAPFAGEAIHLGGDTATLETRGGTRFVRLDLAGGARVLYRVTRVLGGHHREDFVGVQVSGDSVAPAPRQDGAGDELVLPVSYLLAKKRLRYKGYSVMVRERSHIAAGPVWNRTCPYCHNTVPLLSTLLGALAGPKAPHFQGEVVDALLPEDRALRVEVTDEGALRDAVAREVTRLGGAPLAGGSVRDALRSAIDTTRSRFTGDKLLEVGIGCEACHGGARAHAENPSLHPSLAPRAPFLDVRATTGRSLLDASDAEIEDRACARCHQVLFSRYPWTWEGGRRHATPGGSHINSGEARDLLLGGCRGALRCTACHDPHAKDEAAHLAELETPKGNAVCLACHTKLAPPEALRAHAHHDPNGAGGACLACHMPKKNMSLAGGLTRYHRVGSPTDVARVLGDRPVECALCHADRSVESLVATMEQWWHQAYNRDVLRASYGDLGQGALAATLARGKPHEKAVALSALGDRRDRAEGPRMAAELGNDYPLVREFAADALRATYGDACDLDLAADGPTLASALARCSQAAGFVVERKPGRPEGSGGDEPAED